MTEIEQKIKEIEDYASNEEDVKRENANIDADAAMGQMLKFGSETAKYYYLNNVVGKRFAKAHLDGDIHIHDLDFYTFTTTCTQISLRKLFKNGFNTGHGTLREPTNITSYASLACIAIQSNQNDQHGGQSIVDFDYAMGDGVKKTAIRNFRNLLEIYLDAADVPFSVRNIVRVCFEIKADDFDNFHIDDKLEVEYNDKEVKLESSLIDKINRVVEKARVKAIAKTERETYQAMEAFVHNLNTMHSRAGSQVPFSSINYGLDESWEGRLATKSVLLAHEAGLGNGETPIFPIQIFRVKTGVNFYEEDKNYDLFKLACRVSGKRMFPNFAFQDAPFNAAYYKKGKPETEIAYMGCRTRVIGNVFDPNREVSYSRGNVSFTSIDLPRVALEEKNVERFIEKLKERCELVKDQLLERLEFQSRRKVYNFPFLMKNGVWIDSEKLNANDEVRSVLKHGSLSIGFIGLAETLTALVGKHHGQSDEAQKLGIKIVKTIRDKCDEFAERYKLNFTCLATPAESLSGRFVRLDKKRFGVIEGVTDKDYYTNSFHIPVGFRVPYWRKIELEAPYHALTNAGHITYIELDGDVASNPDAIKRVVSTMQYFGIGYGAINHPLDRDPVCGYSGTIEEDVCPGCGRTETKDLKFERIRRITGYLVGTLDRFNDAKRSEEKDRVKHSL